MSNLIIERIDSLPPLPNSVIELEAFRKLPQKEADDLLRIIEKDPLIITTLLRVANSAMFAFRDSVETPKRAISLLGVNFSISIALGSVVQDLIKSNLFAYNISTDDFIFTSNLSSTLVKQWLSSTDIELSEELMLPAFLQEVGKFIISEIVEEENKTSAFQEAIKNKKIADVEKEFVGHPCAKITANIFKHWKLSHNLIFSIGFVGDLENCPKDFIRKSQVLEIIKIVCNVTKPLSDKAIQEAIAKAIEYNFDIEPLMNAIDNLKAKINIKD